jgi:hypothetical protein
MVCGCIKNNNKDIILPKSNNNGKIDENIENL